ncbi:putative cryptochrome DASH, mitochondrial [Naviculisporaceae sp. PSN 640]
MSEPYRVIVHLFRRDLRLSDNPLLHLVSKSSDHGCTRFLPVYALDPKQLEVSGLIKDGSECPYPEAKSEHGRYFRCGPHRAEFLANAIWDTKKSLEALESGLDIRVGRQKEVTQDLIAGLKAKNHVVVAVRMVSHEGVEERRDEKDVAALCKEEGIDFELLRDEKYFIDDRDTGLESLGQLPDVFTTWRKLHEPLHTKPREVLPTPAKGSLPPFPDEASIPPQKRPFVIPSRLEELIDGLVSPVRQVLPNPPEFPEGAQSAHPFKGGENAAQERLIHLIKSEGMKNYKDTRNGLIGTEFSTKLSAYLAQGCITARQIHHALLGYENGTDDRFKDVDGFGAGENEGTAAIRFELLWRDYMRLCHQKFRHKLFRLEGFKSEEGIEYKDDAKKQKWKFPTKERASDDQDPPPERVREMIDRFNAGTTGMGLIDASQRELLHTGYTSNRARQNVASFLAKHLGIDWRYGAEWYEMLLVDYDVSSNWANWQYVAGVGNDPRGELRIFNPIKQAFDYDKEGKYVRSWVPEVSKLEKLENVFQACTASEEDVKAAGLEGNIMVTDPIKRIEFSVEGKPARPNKRPYFRRKAQQGSKNRGAVPVEDGSVDSAPSPKAAVIVSSDSGKSNSVNTVSEITEKHVGHRHHSHGQGHGHYRGGSDGGRGRGGGRGGGPFRGQYRGYHHGFRGAGRGGRGGRGGGGQGHHHHIVSGPPGGHLHHHSLGPHHSHYQPHATAHMHAHPS